MSPSRIVPIARLARASLVIATVGAAAACAARAPAVEAPVAASASAPPAPAVRTSDAPAPTASDLALLAGRWRGKDSEEWVYDLDVEIDGTFSQNVLQPDGDLCLQQGTIDVRDSRVIRSFDSNECNRAYEGETLYEELVGLDSAELVVRTEYGYEIEYARVR